jgi:hypothetical protein
MVKHSIRFISWGIEDVYRLKELATESLAQNIGCCQFKESFCSLSLLVYSKSFCQSLIFHPHLIFTLARFGAVE